MIKFVHDILVVHDSLHHDVKPAITTCVFMSAQYD